MTTADQLAPGLYIVSTPIGNLRDMTERGRAVLAGVDMLLAEDTRVTGKLLKHYAIPKKIQRYDDHTGESQRPRILTALLQGQSVALVSDAGTPLVSDPGYKLVKEAGALGVPVFPIPGASAVLAALAVAGLPTDRFLFAGFPPPKGGPRRAMFEELAGIRATLIFYETGPRLHESLADMATVFGPEREACVARELTKLYETTIRGTLAALGEEPRLQGPKGEIVVLVGPGRQAAATPEDADKALTEALARMSPADAATEVARALGLPRRDLYRRALDLKGAG
jgi:16S rRNA (cytidine1402-2'-O)-methyltransferase